MIAEPIPILSDNYVWCLRRNHDSRDVVIVDPGDAAPVAAVLSARGLQLRAFLITHWHPDHIAGVDALRDDREIPVYGPAAEAARIPMLTHPLEGGEHLKLVVGMAEVIALPGHTLGHIGYAIDDWLICGDTLFSAGCGRLFEGTPAQMHASLQRLDAYPATTRIACTHEYTLANLQFARAVEPDNTDVTDWQTEVTRRRARGEPSLPTTLARERAVNPFLRCDQPSVRAAAAAATGRTITDSVSTFAALRHWKDGFRPT